MKIKATANTERVLWVTDVGACPFNSYHTGPLILPLLTDGTKGKNTITFYFACLVIKLRVLISKCLTL